MSKLIHVRISPESHKKLQQSAASDSRTIAQMARVILERGIESNSVPLLARKPKEPQP